jgi:hypothetical protein
MDLVALDGPIGQAQFLALEHEHGALQRHQQRQRETRQRRVSLHRAAIARYRPRHVVVGEGRAGPQALDRVQEGVVLGEDLRAERPVLEESEGVARVQAMVAAGKVAEQARLLGEFAEYEPVPVFVHGGADLVEHFAVLGQVRVADAALEVGRVGPVMRRTLVHGHRRIVAQLRVMQVRVRHVETEAVDAAVQPEGQHVDRGLARLGVVKIDLGLLLQELVEVILATQRMIRPGRTAEDAEPVVRRRAVLARVGPDIPVGLLAITGLQAFLEPGMKIARVGKDLVEDDLQAAAVGFGDEMLEIGHRAHLRRDAVEVGDVIAEVAVGRWMDGRQPDGIDAQPGNVVELRADALQVADTVRIAVAERARIDLVDDGALPPGRCLLAAHARSIRSMTRLTMP